MARWVDSRVQRLLARLEQHELFCDAEAAAALINERVDHLAAVMHIGQPAARRYFDDAAIDDLADGLAGVLADEAPGANLLTQPRDVLLEPRVLGRTIAGLAEAIHTQLPERDGTADLDHIYSLAQHISALGQMLVDTAGDPTPAPSALVARAATQLERAAGLVGSRPPELGEAFLRDAQQLRALVPDAGESAPASIFDLIFGSTGR